MDKGIFQILQTVFLGFSLIATIVTTVLVWKIGVTQNSINQQALNINDFAEIFLMPQVVVRKKPDGAEEPIGWNILIKNFSAYPIYLNAFILNGTKTNIGSSPIPNQSDSWFIVPISTDAQTQGKFSLVVDFEDYRGKKYQTEGFGLFDGKGWSVTSKKRIEIN